MFLDGRPTTANTIYKIIGSIYLAVAYVLSHIDFHWKPYGQCQEPFNVTDSNRTINNTGFRNGYGCNGISLWPYYWLYFTNWSFNLIVISVILDTILVLKRKMNEKKVHDKSVEFCKSEESVVSKNL